MVVAFCKSCRTAANILFSGLAVVDSVKVKEA